MASMLETGDSGLFTAVREGDEDSAMGLLRSGADPEATDEDGQTALYLAAVEDQSGMVRLLLAAGADPNRGSGPEGADLPLCGAAVGGHTEVVRALLRAGARPDGQEEFGFTALAWAVRQGHAATVEALLEAGADPGLPGPHGEPPLLVATRRGSADTVRALLRHGGATAQALAEALAEAVHWLGRDVADELRLGLERLYGAGYETVTRQDQDGAGVTVNVELLRDGEVFASDDRQTGHPAIATLLERELGIATSFTELARRAVLFGPENRSESVRTLVLRADEESFQTATAWLAAPAGPAERAFAAAVLAGFPEPFRERARAALAPEPGYGPPPAAPAG